MENLEKKIPQNEKEFHDMFSSEDACRDFLFSVRWPEGFQCPACGGQKAWLNSRNLIVCSKCGYQGSLTSGTVMHGTKKPLRMWFHAIWWACCHREGGSARELQKLLGLGSYQTAWAWMQKLRMAMIASDDARCGTLVEAGVAVTGGAEASSRLRFLNERIVLAGVVEVNGPSDSESGRLRLRYLPEENEDAVMDFLKETTAPGTRIITDSNPLFEAVVSSGFVHEPFPGRAVPRHLHYQLTQLRRWILEVHKGAVAMKHLQNYLDEFSFRHNWHGNRRVEETFLHILKGSISSDAVPYWQLVGRTSPDTPLDSGKSQIKSGIASAEDQCDKKEVGNGE